MREDIESNKGAEKCVIWCLLGGRANMNKEREMIRRLILIHNITWHIKLLNQNLKILTEEVPDK